CDKVSHPHIDHSTFRSELFMLRVGGSSGSLLKVLAPRMGLMSGSIFAGPLPVCAQQAEPATPVVVQPGAPGQPTRTLPSSTRATLPPRSQADVQFMQGMIVHHAQAVEMTALIESHTRTK